MAFTNSFLKVVVEKANAQLEPVDTLTEDAPILRTMPMKASSDGWFNTYRSVKSVTGAVITDLDAPVSAVGVEKELKQVALTKIEGKMEIGKDLASQLGGPAKYFADNYQTVLRDTGMDAEKNLYYNTMLDYAFDQSKLVSAGGSANTNFSMLCVKWDPASMTGLYDPRSMSQGLVFEITNMSPNAPYFDANGIPTYGMLMTAFIGLQLADPRYISGIVNIDIANDAPTGARTFPTEMMIDDMIDEARGSESNTAIYCHPTVLSYLKMYKANRLNLLPADMDIKRSFMAWDGVPIITSRNLLKGTETNVTL